VSRITRDVPSDWRHSTMRKALLLLILVGGAHAQVRAAGEKDYTRCHQLRGSENVLMTEHMSSADQSELELCRNSETLVAIATMRDSEHRADKFKFWGWSLGPRHPRLVSPARRILRISSFRTIRRCPGPRRPLWRRTALDSRETRLRKLLWPKSDLGRKRSNVHHR
jgi:hypothetical protein